MIVKQWENKTKNTKLIIQTAINGSYELIECYVDSKNIKLDWCFDLNWLIDTVYSSFKDDELIE